MIKIDYDEKIDKLDKLDKLDGTNIGDLEILEILNKTDDTSSIFSRIRPLNDYDVTYSLDKLDLEHYIDVENNMFVYVNILGKKINLLYTNGLLDEKFKGFSAFPEKIEELETFPICEIRGVLVNDKFIAYEFVAEDFRMQTKSEELYFLEDDLGLEVPLYWSEINGISSYEDLLSVIEDCNEELKEDYDYNIDGLILEGVNCKDNLLRISFWQRGIEEEKIVDVQYRIENERYIPYIITENNEIPIFKPSNIINYQYYKGNEVYYRNTSLGIIPCTKEGKLILSREDFKYVAV